LPEGLALVAVMVVVLRPLVVALGTWGSELSRPERAFMAWLAPRGIVAAATASAFGLQLSESGVSGAEDILPIAFIAIFATVALYGLTSVPVARRLGLAGAGARIVLVVGGQPWGRALATALESAGLGVRLWTGRRAEQAAARNAGLDAGKARLGVDLATREEELEEVSDALLVTDSDDFNALAAYELRTDLGHGHVYRLRPGGEVLDLVPAFAEGDILFEDNLTYSELTRRFDAGARLVEVGPEAGADALDGLSTLFVVSDSGDLSPVTSRRRPMVGPGDKRICLTPIE
jgi:Sodium/hydrogen exchanger family